MSPTHFPPFTPITGTLARECAGRRGAHTLIVLDDERLSYEEADRRSAALAKGLLAFRVGKGTLVGLLAPNSPDWVVGWLAITRIGAVAVLLNTYNKAGELGRTIRHSDQSVLLTVGSHLGHDYLDRLEQAAPELADQHHERLFVRSLPYLRSVWTFSGATRRWCGDVAELVERGVAVDDELLAAVEAEVTPADPTVVVYTSGSTSDPKGAVHTHGAVVRHAHNLSPMRDLRDDDVLYTPMPLFWVGGFSFTLVAAMHAGATLVFEDRFEPGATLDLIERERVTQVLGWPHMAKALVDHPSFATRDLSSIRAGTVAALPPPSAAGEPPPEVPVASSLGMTETLGPHTFDAKVELPPEKAGSFGHAVPGVEHRVVDPLTGADVAPGESGEILVRGYSVMLGFHKRERADTFTADGWYRTGDVGRFDEDGHLFYSGRMGDLVKTSGMNVTPREVEEVLEAIDGVVLAFVTGVDHPDRGQDLVAAVALQPGASLDGADARARVAEELASYKVPRHVEVFASQTDLPWLDSGKVDRRALAALLADRYGQA